MSIRVRIRLASLLAGMFVATQVAPAIGPTAVQAASPGANGRIAWQKNDQDGSHIWTMRTDGSDKVYLAEGWTPAWSPDGTRIAYASPAGLSVMNADGTDSSVVIDHGSAPAWSPDGLQLAFQHYDSGANNYEIFVVDLNGTGLTNLTNDPGEDLSPSWSPDGSSIAFQSNRDGMQQVFSMDADGSNPVNLTVGKPGNDPDWSPDGSLILFLSAGGLSTMHRDGSGKVNLPNTEGWGPAWSPDGTTIAFTSGRDFNDEIYTIRADGTHLVRLVDDHARNATYPEDWYAAWQPTAFAVGPASIGFGDGAIGTPTAARTVTLTAGIDPISVTSVSTSGPAVADFEIVADGCAGSVIPAHASCTVSVRFAATATGARSGSLAIVGPAPLGTASLALTGFGRIRLWGPMHNAGPAYQFTYGRSLAATASHLHAISSTTRVGSKWVKDSGPYVGVTYVRSSNGGASWGSPKRLNPKRQHGSRVGIATAGSSVYAVWVSTAKWVHYRGKDPRVLYLRRNSANGAGSAWGNTIRLTSRSGRVDVPSVAASGSYVYVAYTDSATGDVRLAISKDRGATWRKVTVGATTAKDSSGKLGLPNVAASGSTVAVTWVANASGVVKVSVSTTHGTSWGATTTIGPSTSVADVAVLGDRVAVAWSNDGIRVRVATGGVWAADRTLPPTDGYATETQLFPAIALQGTHRLAVAYTACVAGCLASDPARTNRTDLVWRESNDDGDTWAPSDVLVSSADSGKRRSNDAASIAWPAADRPFVLWNGYTPNTTDFRLYIRAAV